MYLFFILAELDRETCVAEVLVRLTLDAVFLMPRGSLWFQDLQKPTSLETLRIDVFAFRKTERQYLAEVIVPVTSRCS